MATPQYLPNSPDGRFHACEMQRMPICS